MFRKVFAHDGLEVRRSIVSGAHPLFASDRIDGSVMDERQEEAPEGPTGRVERLGCAPEREERIVYRILCQQTLSREPIRDPVRGWRVSPVELVERPSVAGGKAPVKLQILPVAVSHPPGAGRYHRPMQRRPTHRVVLYSRAGCRLCEVARETILSERTRIGFEFAEVDIEGDDELELEYGIRIPVVDVDGEEAFEISVDPGKFARLVG